MSTTGMLRPDEIVFYHPLDDFTEHTQSQAWTGTGGFVAGKIGTPPTAISAITADTLGYGSVNSYGVESRSHEMAALDSDRVLMAYEKEATGQCMVRIGTVSGAEVTWGAEFPTGDSLDSNGYEIGIDMLDASRFIIGYRSSNSAKSRVGTVSGGDITYGPNCPFPAASIPRGVKFAALTSTRAVVMYSDYNGGDEDGKVHVATVSGNDITYGPGNNFDSGLSHLTVGIETMDSNRAIMSWLADSAGGWNVRLAVATVSGADITVGAVTEAATDGSTWIPSAAMLSATKFAFSYTRAVDGNSVWARVGQISGTDITLGAAAEHAVNGGAGDSAPLSSSQAVLAYRALTLDGRPQLTVMTVSGMDLAFGSASTPYPLPGGDSSPVSSCAVCALSATTVVVAATRGSAWTTPYDAQTAVGSPNVQASITAPTPGAYPSTIGDTRVVAAMWAKNLTGGSSTVTVERGYSVAMTATTIALGGTTATWSGAGVSSLMSAMNNGSDHLLVLDFENGGGTTWTLRTSLDGAPFASQGAQTSGAQAVTTVDTAPAVGIADGESGQWIDELIMWSGDKAVFAMFTSEELANLHDLADTFGEGMGKYEENYGAPICWQATAKLPDGAVWRDSGSGPCPAAVRVPRGARDVVVTDDGSEARPRIQEG